jgi:hypothetical protein
LKGSNGQEQGHAAGASKSLKKTTKAIMKFLEDEGDRPQSGLRDFLYDKLGDFAVKWYRKGLTADTKKATNNATGESPAHAPLRRDTRVFHCRRENRPLEIDA